MSAGLTGFDFRLPLVSGFYKLLAVCMKICTKIQYFNVSNFGIIGHWC